MVHNVIPKLAIVFLFTYPVYADTISRSATITGGRYGRCTVEVIVDDEAELEIYGGEGSLRTLSGRPAFWRRFECSTPMPRVPLGFQFVPRNGRGRVRLLRDPGNSRGTALIRISDPQGGQAPYAFDLLWDGSGGGGRGPVVPSPPSWPGHGPGHGGSPVDGAIRLCQDAVSNRLNRDGYGGISFERTASDNKPGRDQWISGLVTGRRGIETTRFSFSCAVDLNSGIVRSVDVNRRWQ